MIDTDFVPFESTVEFEGMSKVSGVWSAFPIKESSYLLRVRVIFVLFSFSNNESLKFLKFVLKVLRQFLSNCCSSADRQVMSVHEVMTPVY